MAALTKNRKSLPEKVASLLAEYGELDARAEAVIEAHVAAVAARSPGVPKGVIRTCEIDARARGFSYPMALRQLRSRLMEN